MDYLDELAMRWREYDYPFEARTVLPNGDEIWTYTTFELGLPVLWVKHPDGSFEYRVIHTPGYGLNFYYLPLISTSLSLLYSYIFIYFLFIFKKVSVFRFWSSLLDISFNSNTGSGDFQEADGQRVRIRPLTMPAIRRRLCLGRRLGFHQDEIVATHHLQRWESHLLSR